MSPSSHPPTYGDYPNYAANFAHTLSESLLSELRDYLANQESPKGLVAAVEDALASLNRCRGSRQQGYDLRPHSDLLAAIDQAIDAVVLVNVRTNAVVDVGTESRLVELRRAREGRVRSGIVGLRRFCRLISGTKATQMST